MSRIVRFHKAGGPEVLQIENVDVPAPGPDEIRIKVKALGLNRAESMFRQDKYLERPVFPSKIGYEAAGTVESVGKNVTEFKIGDIVSTAPIPSQVKYGVYGELALVPARYVIKHPSNLSFEEAASIWMQYLTAYGALIDIAQMKKGDFVVIPAASSSVGLAAIQLCNMVGATPIATTRTHDKAEVLKKEGAAHVIATEEEDVAKRLNEITAGKGARIVFDPVGGKTVNALAAGMAENGILFIYGGLSTDPTPFPVFAALAKTLTMRGYVLWEILRDDKRFAKAKEFIVDGLKNKKLKPIIAKTFPLDQIVDAHRYLESNQQIGKIVVTV